MAGAPTRLSISDAVDEILRRQRAANGGSVPAAQSRSGPAQPDALAGVHYGALYAPPPDDFAKLRRQQAAFGRTTQDLDNRNSWMAIPALAPLALPALDGIAALGLRAAVGAVLPKKPLDFPELESWQRNSRQPAAPLNRNAKTALREVGRDRFAQANLTPAKQMGAEVHHSDPLQWAHLKPRADPNRLAKPLAFTRRRARHRHTAMGCI